MSPFTISGRIMKIAKSRYDSKKDWMLFKKRYTFQSPGVKADTNPTA